FRLPHGLWRKCPARFETPQQIVAFMFWPFACWMHARNRCTPPRPRRDFLKGELISTQSFSLYSFLRPCYSSAAVAALARRGRSHFCSDRTKRTGADGNHKQHWRRQSGADRFLDRHMARAHHHVTRRSADRAEYVLAFARELHGVGDRDRPEGDR